MLENDFPDLSATTTSLLILCLLTDQDEEILDRIPAKCVAPLVTWMMPELVQERVMKVEQWIETAFHLCKQRYDESIDWMEKQPMSKILLMIRVMNGFNEEQNREMKKAGRKR